MRPARAAFGLHRPRPHARQRGRACRARGARPPGARDPRRPGAAPLVRQAQVRAPRRAPCQTSTAPSPTRSPRRSTRPSSRLARRSSRCAPASTEDVPFADMLTRSVDDFEARSGLRVEFTARPRASRPTWRRACRWSCCASSARPSPTCASTPTPRSCASAPRSPTASCVITVTDNGRGFVQEEAFDRGMGLRGMQERARLIGGSLRVTLGARRAARPSRSGRRS